MGRPRGRRHHNPWVSTAATLNTMNGQDASRRYAWAQYYNAKERIEQLERDLYDITDEVLQNHVGGAFRIAMRVRFPDLKEIVNR